MVADVVAVVVAVQIAGTILAVAKAAVAAL
jgi:hypothetical protein